MRAIGIFLIGTAIVGVQWTALSSMEPEPGGLPGWLPVLLQSVLLLLVLAIGTRIRSFGRFRPGDVAWALAVAMLGFILSGLVYGVQAYLGLESARSSVLPGAEHELAWLLLYALVFTPLLEEWLFRGVIQTVLIKRWPRTTGFAIVGQAMLFGLFHLSWAQLLPTMMLGVLLGWLAWKRQNLWGAILAHAIYNGLGFGMMFLYAHPPV